MLIDILYTKLHMAQPVPGSQTLGKTRKNKVRKKLASGKKEEVSSRFIFVFALCQFSGPDYLVAWNRLHMAKFRL